MPAIVQQVVSLHGELAAFTARSADGWGTGTLRTEAETVPITGKLVGVRVGDAVALEGIWVDHPRWGRQLKVRSCTAVRPQTADGTVAWLASTLPDVGLGRAKKLVERFGDELWDVIEHHLDELTKVEGITPARAKAIQEAYRKHSAQRDHMIALRGWGLTDSQIARCLEQWGTLGAVIDRVRENPYQLAQCVYGFGFKRADEVAMKAGVKFDSPARVAAGVEHVLDEECAKGHCFLPAGALVRITQKLLGVQSQPVATAIRTAVRSGRAVRRGARVYSRRMDQAEEQCAVALRRLLGRAA